MASAQIDNIRGIKFPSVSPYIGKDVHRFLLDEGFKYDYLCKIYTQRTKYYQRGGNICKCYC